MKKNHLIPSIHGFLTKCFLLIVFLLLAQFAYGAETPLSNESMYRDFRNSDNFTSCGLVETTWDDSDWVLATSDRILRERDCIAECADSPESWYDSPFDPCYPENRYWKFEENSGTAFAFPMAAIGIGSFDGIYIRRNIKFQLYEGADEDSPFGPEMRGPKYISIDGWKDSACEGFDPNTFFVTGGPGALADYSIKIGGDTSILDVDLKKEDNMNDHNSKNYKTYFVLRRGQGMSIDVELGEEYGPGCHEIYFEATMDGDDGNLISIPFYEATPPENEWGCTIDNVITNENDTKTVAMKLYIPGDAPIGKYEMISFVKNKNTIDPTAQKEFLEPVYIVFNPWSPKDEAYMDSEQRRSEYVLNTIGQIWRGGVSDNRPKAWRYDQFSENTLELSFDLIKGLPVSDRSNPSKIARKLSKMVNSNDDGGVLVGKWGKEYPGGTHPSYWSGSDQIIKQYVTLNTPVKYGQCWVFGGLLNSFLRCLGLPARPITNFESAHDYDKPLNKVVDYYYDMSFRLQKNKSDSIWNFHVWCDVWFNSGWHAVDATPQELSGGAYQLGPASHEDILNDMGGNYDVDFVYSEVDADLKKWYPISGVDTLIETDTEKVGRNITTKAVGSLDSIDITNLYKIPESSRGNRNRESSEVAIEVVSPGSVEIGGELRWEIALSNVSVSDAFALNVNIYCSVISYNGDTLEEAGSVSENINLLPSEDHVVSLIVDSTDYLKWTGYANTFEVTFSVFDTEKNNVLLLDTKRTIITAEKPQLSISNVQMATGETAEIELLWSNPLSEILEDVKVVFFVSQGLAFDGGKQEVEVVFGEVEGGELITINKNIEAIGAGNQLINATIFSDRIDDLFADKTVQVYPDCNNNQTDDALDIENGTSGDCDVNSIPDECEFDCNDNGLSDKCEILENNDLDCNGNGYLDECDILGGVSFDDNNNGVPDECEDDCNDNGIPDDLDIENGTSSDFNENGIPDICDEDCNGNGISDELDIKNLFSNDENMNGVPDECEGEDDCPNDPNKTDPGVCGCGVPDTDTDADGTPDCIDECPNDATNTCNDTVYIPPPPVRDSDGDGTTDPFDDCPNDPGKTRPGLCGCGVPDTDSDDDGTPDCIDECPGDPEKIETGECGCGTTDIDTDEDGVSDCVDNCPEDPAKTEPGVCGCGVADVDSDDDGVMDCVDECPADPEKTQAGVCGCGVPDVDTDEDGTFDCDDQCPDDPAKTEPGVCGCGVADTDTDSDGTPDCNDNCPADPEKTEPGLRGCGVSENTPMADAGEDLSVNEGVAIQLNGANSSDPNGLPLSFHWEQTGGTPVVLSSATVDQPTFVPVVPAGSETKNFRLTIRNDSGMESSDEVAVTVTNSEVDGYPEDVLPIICATGKTMGTKTGSGNLVWFQAENPVVVEEGDNGPDDQPYGMMDALVKVDQPGETAVLTFYLSEPAPENSDWYAYAHDEADGWRMLSEYATFNEDRDEVTLTLTDGGPADADGTADGTITLASGLGVNTVEDDGGDGGICLIASAASGSGSGESWKFMAFLLVMGIALSGKKRQM